LQGIGRRAFRQTALRAIEIPARVEYIEDEAFLDCPSLENATFEEGSRLKKIGQHAFESSLLKLPAIEIPVNCEIVREVGNTCNCCLLV
jgi:hypothetical protein